MFLSQTLCKCVNKDTAAVQRHRNTVVDNLKDADISIRRRALDLIYALVTKNNVKALVKELLNYLALTSGDLEFKADLTEKICLVVERFAPSKHWHIDTIIQVLQTAGNFTRENVATDLILLIARTPNLQAYSVYKLFHALYKKYKHAQLPLIHVVVWCCGEYGDMLISEDGYQQAFKVENANPADTANGLEPGTSDITVVSETMLLDLMHKVMKSPLAQNITKQYILNALIKLTGRFAPNGAEKERLKEYIAEYDDSMNMELQQRSCEYSTLVGDALSKIRNGVVGRMPVPAKKSKSEESGSGKEGAAAASPASKKSEESSEEEEESSDEEETGAEDAATARARTAVPQGNGAQKKPAAAAAPTNLFDMDLLGGTGAAPASSPAPASAARPAAAAAQPLDLMDLFGSQPAAAAPASSPQQQQGGGSFDLFGMPSAPAAAAPSSSPAASANTFDMFGAAAPAASPNASNGMQSFPSERVFESKGLGVTFHYSRAPSAPEVLHVVASFSNSGSADLTNFDFQVAVLKNVVLTMSPATSTTIPAGSNGAVTQKLVLNNTLHGKKKMVIRVKIDYKVQGQPHTETAQIAKFPE